MKHPAKCISHTSCDSGNTNFSNRHVISCWSCDQNIVLLLRVGTFPCKSTYGFVWPSWVFYSWRYNVFNVSSDFTKQTYVGVIQIFRWEILMISQSHLMKGSQKFMGGNSLWYVITQIIFLHQSCDNQHNQHVLNFSRDQSQIHIYRIVSIYGLHLFKVSYHLAMFVGDWSSV